MEGDKTMPGMIHGVGVGPGDPELLTLKAARLIAAADLVAYPAPETGESFARRIVASFIKPGTEEFAIRMNIGDGQFPKDDIYAAAAERLLTEAKAGRSIVVLCEGDPFFYGSFMYLYAHLAGKVPLAIVPGVSSLMACAIASGSALAARNDVLTIIPAPLSEQELKRRLEATDAAAIIKLGRHLPKLRIVLADLGLVAETRYVEHASLADEKVMPLADMTEKSAPYFSMLLVHKRGKAWA
jgi:precorrin-2/cobalt-factor-2 C20-methyltransferase